MSLTDSPSKVPPRGAIRAFFVFVFLDLGFRLVGFDHMTRFLTRRRPRSDCWQPEAGKKRAQATFLGVQQATKFYYRHRKDCLPKALATFHLLRRQGIPACLVYGVRKFPFEAHAWVEAYGQILDDCPPRIAGYAVIHRAT